VVSDDVRSIGPGQRIIVRFRHCFTEDEIGKDRWTWEVWPAECNEETPWNNVYHRRVIVRPGVRAGE